MTGSTNEVERELALLTRELAEVRAELAEALEQQAATSNILRVISSSPTDVQPVFDSIAESVVRIFQLPFCAVFRFDGKLIHFAAHHGLGEEGAAEMQRVYPLEPGRGSSVARAIASGSVEQIVDVREDADYVVHGAANSIKARAILGVPILKGGRPVGAISIAKTSPGPFPERQIELLRTFANQAVIAIENVRLFDEVRLRNEELAESLEQQTATSEVLQVISRSTFDLPAVLRTLVESAAKLCNSNYGGIYLREGNQLRPGATLGASAEETAEVMNLPLRFDRKTISGRVALTGRVEQIPDVLEDADYDFPVLQRFTNIRALMGVPLLRKGTVEGVFFLGRPEAGAFTPRQSELVQTFADQAVIAIENARLLNELEQRNRQVTEALEQQTATGKILAVIASSPTDIKPVLSAVVESAAQLCDAYDAVLFLKEGDMLALGAHHGPIPISVGPWRISRKWASGRAVVERAPIQVEDLQNEQDEFPEGQEMASRMGHRTTLSVPLLREGEAIGTLTVRRTEVRRFSEKQVSLLRTFADQAVIAIENVRLFEALQARTGELTESLQQQTATADVLKVISRSTFDLQAVLDTLIESASRLCRADKGGIVRPFDGVFRYVAIYGYPPSFRSYLEANPPASGRGSAVGRVAESRSTVQISDVLADPDYKMAAVSEAGGFRTVLAVPLLRQGDLIGVFALTRVEALPFNDKEIELVKTFADQAVIAIENVRLFEEVQARNRELTEALEQQVATSSILRVIASSPTDIQPVLDTVTESAARLCDAYDATLFLRRGDVLPVAAHHGAIAIDFAELPMARNIVSGRAALDRVPVHVHDLSAAGDEYAAGRTMARRLGFRTILATPLLREGETIGALMIRRAEVRPFSEKQIELLKTFADQAVIAIENVRLFEEVRARTTELTEALGQQTATADVLKVISRSAFDLQGVLQTLIISACKLCGADEGGIFMLDGDLYRLAANYGATPALVAYEADHPTPVGRDSYVGRTALERAVVHVPDVRTDAEYGSPALAEIGNFRAVLSVPLMREGLPIGVFAMGRARPGPFSQRQIELVQTFADQAVIAIENVRLFEQVQARTTELTEALQQQTATADVLKVISRSAFDLDTVLTTLVRTAIQLCEAARGAIWLRKGEQLSLVAHSGVSEAWAEHQRRNPITPASDSMMVAGLAAFTGELVNVEDIPNDPRFRSFEAHRLGDYRGGLAVPLKREGRVEGVIGLSRTEARLFTPRQCELVQTFADQAVIAIENVRLFDEVQARNRELTEALEQQTATGTILRAIAASPNDIQPVLDTVAESAAKLCQAFDALIVLRDGDSLAVKSHYGGIPLDFASRPIGRSWVTGRAFLERKPLHVHDVSQQADEFPLSQSDAGRLGHRTLLAVPLLRDEEAIGVIVIRRIEVLPFTQKQVDLLTTFADQAVIAIENVRLFEEVQARTAELSEALEQQTATSEVLQAISSSPGELEPVFQAMLENATRICEAKIGILFRYHDGAYNAVAHLGIPPEFAEYLARGPRHPNPDTTFARLVKDKKTVHVVDTRAEPVYASGDPQRVATVELLHARSLLDVPMLKDGELIGAISIIRHEVRPFTDKQIELVTNFAAQAVIAIENTRLLKELRESLEQQTATADVLKVISRSAFDLQIVLDTLLESAARLCRADKADMVRFIDGTFQYVAMYGYAPELETAVRSHPLEVGRGSANGRAMAEKRTVHIVDVLADPEYRMGAIAEAGDFRTVLAVPLLRGGNLVGIIALLRSEVQPFSEKEIELVTTFADQAVIAIENVRLFNEVDARNRELREALEQQTATADVLKVISRSAFDLETVLQTLVESAARLCDADKATITRQVDGTFYRAEAYGFSSEFIDYVRTIPVEPEPGSATGRALLTGQVVHIGDVEADPEYTFREARKLGGFRTILGVPMLRDGVPTGVLALTRSAVRPFSEKQIELVSTFADQAAIAMENARLFEEVRARTRDLSRSLEELRTAQDRLVQTEKLASLGQLTAGIAHEIKNPLNFVNNFSLLSVELLDELKEMLESAGLGEGRRAEVEELSAILRGNLEKVVQHGKRADSIVKNMLLHSRQGSGEHRPADINAIVEESVNLAYHGARAEKQGFNITLEKSLDPAAGDVDLFPQEITRVLLNLISNGFYATTKRRETADGKSYEPTLLAATRNLGDRVEIRIRDNGTGIPREVRERMFDPFFTTKPAGEGTGLGLSLSHDIIVKQHSGTIEVETEPGEFTEFRIVLPRAGAALGQTGGKA